jgi:hypothetical protein
VVQKDLVKEQRVLNANPLKVFASGSHLLSKLTARQAKESGVLVVLLRVALGEPAAVEEDLEQRLFRSFVQ